MLMGVGMDLMYHPLISAPRHARPDTIDEHMAADCGPARDGRGAEEWRSCDRGRAGRGRTRRAA